MTSKDYISPNEFLPALPPGHSIDRLFPHNEESSRLLVSCITADGEQLDNRVVVELRVSHRSPLAAARSLERYGYEVLDVEHDALAGDDIAADRIKELMHYIDL